MYVKSTEARFSETGDDYVAKLETKSDIYKSAINFL